MGSELNKSSPAPFEAISYKIGTRAAAKKKKKKGKNRKWKRDGMKTVSHVDQT